MVSENNSSKYDIRWEEEGPLGNVFLDEEKWTHIQEEHKVMKDYDNSEESIRETIKDPDLIKNSSIWEDRDIYFGKDKLVDGLFIKVVVDTNENGRIITGFLQDNTMQGTGAVKYVNYKNTP